MPRNRTRAPSRSPGGATPTGSNGAPGASNGSARPAGRRSPEGFDTRTHALAAPSHGRVAGADHGPSPAAMQARFREIMRPPAPAAAAPAMHSEQQRAAGTRGPAPKRGRGGEPPRQDKNAARLRALAKEDISTATHAVRPDYFGTAEHKALGEYLRSILEGRPVIGQPSGDPSHVLLYRKDAAPGLALQQAPLSLDRLAVAGNGSAWLDRLRDALGDLLADYDPNRELYVKSGLTLRYGEVIALAGDYFESPEELHDELTPEVAAAIRNVTPQSPGTFMLSTHRGWFEYLGLANRNQVHFTPRNWVTYARHHAQALKHALARSYEDALFANAFADHFLSDAFASGHLRVPRDALEGLSGAPASRKMHNEENAAGLWVQDLAGDVWRAYGDDHLGTNPVHVVLAAYAVGTSLDRIHRAYRLEGDAAGALARSIDAGLAALPQEDDQKVWPAGLWKSPATLPDFLGRWRACPTCGPGCPFRSAPAPPRRPARWPTTSRCGGSTKRRVRCGAATARRPSTTSSSSGPCDSRRGGHQ